MAESMYDMVYGKGTVELVVREDSPFTKHYGVIVEPADCPGLVWARFNIFSISPNRFRDSYHVDYLGAGASGSHCVQNVRNFVQVSA
jgi:hypothetical protein